MVVSIWLDSITVIMITQCFDDSEKILEEKFKVIIFFIIEKWSRKANIHGDFNVPDFSGQQGVRKINPRVPQLS